MSRRLRVGSRLLEALTGGAVFAAALFHVPTPYWIFAGVILAFVLTPAVLTDKGPSTVRSFALRAVAAVVAVVWSLALAWGTLDHVLLWTTFAVTSVISVWADAFAISQSLPTLRRTP